MLAPSPSWRVANLLAFSALGLLLGFWGHGKVVRQLVVWAEKLRKMPADDKIAVIFGALLGVLFAVLLSISIGELLRPISVPIGPRIAIPVAPLTDGVVGSIFVPLGV